MSTWLAPAKLNLTLMVRPRTAAGLHPIQSLIQTIDRCDRVRVTEGDEDRLEIRGADLPEGGDNLVWKAVAALDRVVQAPRPRLGIVLNKRIPVAAGLGGGSADAAAMLAALGKMRGIDGNTLREVAPRIGSDVPAALRGGSLWVEGYGERLSSVPTLSDFAVVVAVPDFPLQTADVYRVWDDLGGPRGGEFPYRGLPPSLRGAFPVRNDLHPAAVHLRPELGDMMDFAAREWGRPVAMSGSGPAVFSFFMDAEEAVSASGEVSAVFGATFGAALFPDGPREMIG